MLYLLNGFYGASGDFAGSTIFLKEGGFSAILARAFYRLVPGGQVGSPLVHRTIRFTHCPVAKW